MVGVVIALRFEEIHYRKVRQEEKQLKFQHSIISVLGFINTFPLILDDKIRASQSEGLKRDFFVDEFIEEVDSFEKKFDQNIIELHSALAEAKMANGDEQQIDTEYVTLIETEAYAKTYLNSLKRTLRAIKQNITKYPRLTKNLAIIREFNSALQVGKENTAKFLYQFYLEIRDTYGKNFKDQNELKKLDGKLWAYVQRNDWILNRLSAFLYPKCETGENRPTSPEEYFTFEDETIPDHKTDIKTGRKNDRKHLADADFERFYSQKQEDMLFKLEFLPSEKNNFQSKPFQKNTPFPTKDKINSAKSSSSLDNNGGTDHEKDRAVCRIIDDCFDRQILLQKIVDVHHKPPAECSAKRQLLFVSSI
ncbi:MAG: hypothetical protein ABF661_03235 [Oenococcus sp.]|uniref:hypothetical protein n=1 Tax=Oenococcus sp. TaxID=1979414 RepID=UPI0039EC6ABB